MPERDGPPPDVIGPRPHAQRSQNAPRGLQDELVRRGKIEPRSTSKGEIVYSFLLRHGGQRLRITIGSDREGWTLERAEQKRDDIVSALRLGVPLEDVIPQPEPKKPVKAGGEPTIAEIIADYLEDRRGVVATKTYKHDESACAHIGAFFGKHTPSEIAVEEVDRFGVGEVQSDRLDREIESFDEAVPAGNPSRDILEHFDEHARGEGRLQQDANRNLSLNVYGAAAMYWGRWLRRRH